MVTTQNGVRLTDMELRHAVEAIMARKGWGTNQTASHAGVSESKLLNWLEHAHEIAMTNFRGQLVRFVELWEEISAPGPVPQPVIVAEPPPIYLTEPDTLPGETELKRCPRCLEATMIDAGNLRATCGNCGSALFPVDLEPPPEPVPAAGWVLPDGFAAIAPLPRTNVRPAGITIALNHDRCALSMALVAALGSPERVLIAQGVDGAGRPVAIVTTEHPAHPALRLSKDGGVSKSVALWSESQGIAPGFYPATDAGDGIWVVAFGEGN